MLKFFSAIFFLFFFSIFFTACSSKNQQIADLKNYSQNPFFYTKDFDVKLENQNEHANNYMKRFYFPWNIEELSYTKEEATWGNYYINKKIYLENYNLASKEWFAQQLLNANFENYNTHLQKAITIKNSNLRVFPTENKMFFDPSKAGEGFPFDYNQNSSIKINTPLLISHLSKDKTWAFVQSHFALGWIRIDNIIFVDENFINEFKTDDYYIAIKESFPIFDTQFVETIKIGTIFPKVDNKYIIASKNGINKINIIKNKISRFPINLNKENLALLSNEFIGELYSWGGLNNHRDCSSFTQDFFAPFGIYLKRNSKGQTQDYKYIDVSNLNDKEKKEFIKKNAIAFLTLIYLRGHVMLYIGIKDNQPMVMHNMWGVRTWDFFFTQGRNIVGKTVITTLEPGLELNNVDKNKTILKKIQGIVLLNQKKY